MKLTVVRYRTKPETAEENARLIQAVFQENGLARNKAIAIVEDVKAIASEIQRGGVRG